MAFAFVFVIAYIYKVACLDVLRYEDNKLRVAKSFLLFNSSLHVFNVSLQAIVQTIAAIVVGCIRHKYKQGVLSLGRYKWFYRIYWIVVTATRCKDDDGEK